MTEKSEDQVVYLCTECKLVNCKVCTEEQAYIPHSQYIALKSDLAVAVEALTSLVGHTEATLQFPHKDKIDLVMSLDRAKEALGKIGGGK